MLRDSKLSFERISPVARAAVVAVVLVAGLLVAGLRGPGWSAQARAEEAAKTPVEGSTVAPTSDANGQIDMSLIPAECSMFIAMRPADAVGRPEVAGWAKLLERDGILPNGKRFAEFRQISVIWTKPTGILRQLGMENVSTDIESQLAQQEMGLVIVFQSIDPLIATSLMPNGGAGAAVKDLGDRKIYEVPPAAFLQYDAHTVIQFRFGGLAIVSYFADDLGTEPRWLPRETWKVIQRDHLVIACDPNQQFSLARHFANRDASLGGLSALSPLWEESTCLIAGLRVGDAVHVHATAVAKNEAGAETIEKTVEAARVLARNLLKELDKTTSERRTPHGQAWPLALLADPLDTVKVSREGAVVRAEGSIGMAAVKEIEKAMFTAAVLARSNHNLKMLGIAVHNYEAAYKRFPPAVLLGPDRKTPHSWRVAILPYIEQMELYKQYRFDEPWDSPANRKVLEQMPDVYRSPTEPAGSTNACYFALTGPETVFDGNKGTTINIIRDGTSNTIMFVEAKRDIPWTKPEDIPYAADKPLPKLGGFFEGFFHVVLCSGEVRTLLDSIPEKTLRGLITKAGGEHLQGSHDPVEVKR